jgi:hypothetical protein
MARERKPTDPQAREIFEIHRRYIEVMETRLTTVEEQTRASYIRVMTVLTEKLAVPGKPLSEVVREIMAEAGPILFQVMQG